MIYSKWSSIVAVECEKNKNRAICEICLDNIHFFSVCIFCKSQVWYVCNNHKHTVCSATACIEKTKVFPEIDFEYIIGR